MTMISELTRKQILEMPAGRELDALVCDALNIHKEFECPHCGGDCFHTLHLGKDESEQILACDGYSTQNGEEGGCGRLFKWSGIKPVSVSTDIAAAWQVLEKAKPDSASVSVHYFFSDNSWYVEFGGLGIQGESESAPLAICRAALLTTLKAS